MAYIFKYWDGIRGIRFQVCKNPPKNIPRCDKIKMTLFGKGEEPTDIWVHMEEAAAIATGMNKCLLHMMIQEEVK